MGQAKKVLFITSLLLFVQFCNAVINVQFSKSSDYYEMTTFDYKGVEYFRLNDLNSIIKGQIKELIVDDRIHFTLYKKELTFCIESSYGHVASYNKTTAKVEDIYFNFFYPIIFNDGYYALPEHFLKEILPTIFVDKIKYSNEFLYIKEQNKEPIDLIVLDPGHGGKDPGAVGANGLQEKNLTLESALLLKERIQRDLDIEVLLTRESDIFVPLKERTTFANERDADLFISLHCNAARNKKASGIEVYYLSEAKTDESRAAQALENSVVAEFEGEDALAKYSQADYVVSDMIQEAQLVESISLAYKAQTNMIVETGAKDRGVKSANFFVLRGAYMPAILLELGFISNIEEGKKLSSNEYQLKLIESIYYAVKSFKVNFDRNNCLE